MDFAAVKKKVIAGFAWQGATKALVQTASWVSTIFVARLVAPSDYGIMAAAAVFTQLLVVVTELGMSQGLIQKKETTRQEEDGVFYLALLLGGAIYTVLYLAAPTIAAFYSMPVLTEVLRVLGVVVILGSLKTVPLAIVMRRMDFRYRSLVEMGGSLVMTATVITLAILGYGVWALVWGPIAHNLFIALAYLPLLRRIPRPTAFTAEVFAVLSFGAKVMLTHVQYFAWSRADVMVIGRTLGEQLLGFYSMAFQLAVLPLDKVGAIFNHVMFPALSRLQDNLRESQQLFLELHRYLLMVSYPVLFGMIVVADDLIEVLLTETWLPIVPYLQGLCLVSALRISGMLMPPALYARGKPGVMARYSFLCLMLLPPTFLVGAQFGLGGIVAGWALAYPMLYYVLGRVCLADLQLRWRDLLRSAAPAAGAAAVMMVGVYGFRLWAGDELGLLTRLLASIGIGGTLYIGYLAVLYREQLLDFRQRMTVLRRGGAQT